MLYCDLPNNSFCLCGDFLAFKPAHKEMIALSPSCGDHPGWRSTFVDDSIDVSPLKMTGFGVIDSADKYEPFEPAVAKNHFFWTHRDCAIHLGAWKVPGINNEFFSLRVGNLYDTHTNVLFSTDEIHLINEIVFHYERLT